MSSKQGEFLSKLRSLLLEYNVHIEAEIEGDTYGIYAERIAVRHRPSKESLREDIWFLQENSLSLSPEDIPDTDCSQAIKNHFVTRVEAFNKMYGAPTPVRPTWPLAVASRLKQFDRMLKNEVAEGEKVIENFVASERKFFDLGIDVDAVKDYALDAMVDLSDWLIDIIVYCLSEATRHGIPIREVFDIVMDSNASKLDENGQPIVVDGKIMKGPNYWKPDPKIRELLKERMYGHLRVETKPKTEDPSSDVGRVEHTADG
jgi:predicted HAD superfamily Cof-like phosphohydrolase